MLNVEFPEKENRNKFIVKRESHEQAYLFLSGGVNVIVNDSDGSSLKVLKDLNRAEVTNHLLMVSKAYVYANETLEKLINEEASEVDLSKQGRLIKLIREVLKGLAKYEENYEAEVLEKYKNN